MLVLIVHVGCGGEITVGPIETCLGPAQVSVSFSFICILGFRNLGLLVPVVTAAPTGL